MNWQSLITGILVGLATLAVARRFFGLFSGKSGSACGSCGGCSGKTAGAAVTPLIQLGASQGTGSASKFAAKKLTEPQQRTANER